MTARCLDGRLLAAAIKDTLSKQIAQCGLTPGLSVILVGENPASARYVSHKERACKEVGIRSTCHRLAESVTQAELNQLIESLNADASVHGILLQLPLPAHIDESQLLEKIVPGKDVDGFHPYNLGRLVQRRPALRPCTPYGIIQLLQSASIDLVGKHAVIVSASNIVGRPLSMELLLQKATVTIAHRFTKDIDKLIAQADIFVTAIGKTGVIDAGWIKPGAIVVDVGTNEGPDGRLVGDLDHAIARERAGWLTPVPGGVGPMTVATLMQNTLHAAVTGIT